MCVQLCSISRTSLCSNPLTTLFIYVLLGLESEFVVFQITITIDFLSHYEFPERSDSDSDALSAGGETCRAGKNLGRISSDLILIKGSLIDVPETRRLASGAAQDTV